MGFRGDPVTRAELEAIRAVVREELARVIHSGTSSEMEAPHLVKETRCDEESEYMDPTNTESDGDASSLERMARDDVARLRRGQPLRPTSRPRAARRRGAR